ncbi:MAG: DUF3089 domain-containing protein [Myxococcota bacterium]
MRWTFQGPMLSALFACAGEVEPADIEVNPFAADTSPIYEAASAWLCHPDLEGPADACAANLDTTVVYADASIEIVPFERDPSPTIDCFYVYPTISLDLQGNSDLTPGEEEFFVIATQAARYGAACQVFAPVYPQTTLAALELGIGDPDPDVAYAGVAEAFRHYLAQDNEGRGFLLVGHSQGAEHLTRLVREVIEPEPYAQRRMVAAHLLGASVDVPVGAVVGAALKETPLCSNTDPTGCVVTYASFRANAPPVAGDPFGASTSPGTVPGCVNPASLSGEAGELLNHSTTITLPAFAMELGQPPSPFSDPDAHPPITTPFVQMPGLLSARCVSDEVRSYLAIEVLADPLDPRADDIGGDSDEGWGLHLGDVALAQGNLVQLALEQGKQWRSAHRL